MSALDEDPTVLAVRKHLIEFLGAPREVFEIAGSPTPDATFDALNIAYFAPQGPQAPVVFATCGASVQPMPDGRRIEGMLLLRREPPRETFDAVQRVLAQFAVFSASTGQSVALGDMVQAKAMLSPFCPMDAVLFMPPAPFIPAFHRASLSEEESVEIVWLLPVYQAEADYAVQHGPQALMMLFAAQGIDLTDTHRPMSDTTLGPDETSAMARAAVERAEGEARAQDPSATKPKSSRQDMNQGSYQVEESGQTVRVTRRGGVKRAPRLPGPPPAPAPRSSAEPEPPTPPAPRAHPPARRPIVVRPPARKEEIKFDLGPRAPNRRPPPETSSAPTTDEAKKRKAPPKTKEEKAAAKKARVAALKAAAKEAAQRAANRKATSGPDEAAPHQAAPHQAAPGDRTAVRAAAKRRGGAGSALEEDG